MASTDTDIISDSDIAFLSSADFDLALVLSVYYVEDLLRTAVQTLEYYIIALGTLDLHYVHYAVVVGYLERKD